MTAVRLARRHRRQNVAVLLLASAFGIWLGATAPQSSPAAPAAPPPGAAPAQAATRQPTTVPTVRPRSQGRRR